MRDARSRALGRGRARAIPFPAREMALMTALVMLTALLAGCNTVEGAGQDVQAGGRAIERAVD